MIPEKAIKKVKNEIHLEIAAGSLLAYGVFPQTSEGIRQAKETAASKDTWVAPSDLPEYYDGIDSDLLTGKENDAIRAIRKTLKEFYGIEKSSSAGTVDFIDTSVVEGETQIYKPADKFVDDGKEFADKIVTDLDDALEETSNQIMDDIDAILEADKKKYEDFKKQLNRKVDHPKLYSELQHINPRYMWGQNGLYDLEFKSDIDRAIYFAGKLSKQDTPDKVAVRAWLMEVTGLDVRGDYEEVKGYRTRILELILQLIKLHPNERDVIVPPVYDGYYQDPEEEDEEDEEDYEDLEEDFDGLDDLLNDIKSEEDIPEKKVADDVEEQIVDAAEEDDEGDIGSPDDIPDELLQDEIDPELLDQLLDKINKPKKESSYTSNKKIFDAIISNFGRIQSTLDTVNRNLENQNELIKASIETQLAVGELISNQTTILTDKFDLILKQFEMQNDVAEDQADITKRAEDESRLESQRDAAGIVDFQDLTKSRKKKRENKIEKYLKSRLTRKLYRKLPRSVRRARQKARNLQRIPGKAKAKVVNKLTSMLPSKSKQAAGALSKIRGAGNIGRIAGPARYVFAGLEYSERKQSGQSEVQALSGVGGGLAGAAAGGIAGAKAGAVLGGAIGALFGGVGAAPGAAIGGILGGLIGSIGGGMAGSGIADTVTGAHETGTRLTKPGTAILHGTEAVVKKDAPVDMSAMSTLGGIMLASTTQFINSAGAVAAPIAPVFKGMAGQLAQQYDIPPTIAQTNIGGSLPQLDKELKKIKEKRKQTPEEELKGIEKDLLETQDEKSFVEKLLKIIDPEGKFQELLKKINSGGNGTGDFNIELIGEGAFDTGLRTGPSETIGGSAAYHQDLSFASGVSIEDQRKLILQLAVAYDKVGRELVLSNQGVHGRVFPVKGSKEEQIKWIEDARAAHRARGGGTGRDAIDFYTPLKGKSIFDKSVENTPILAPVVEGGQRSYFSGGAGGAGISITKDGKEILKIIHGRTDIPLPKDGAIPSAPKPAPVTPQNPPSTKPQSISSVVAPPSQTNIASINTSNFISAPTTTQQNYLAQLETSSTQTEDKNDMLIINNQQQPMPTYNKKEPSIILESAGKSPSEVLKNLMLQRLLA